MNFERSRALQVRGHQIIPGGGHTYAKGDDQYPENAPSYLVRGEGCQVWDVDGNQFTEYGMGLRAVTLGHAFKPVIEAAGKQMRLGSNYTRPAAIEIDCAEKLLSLIPGAEMVKFAKNGSDANSAAVKLARACTGRDMIAICGDHPFYSIDDWFIGVTPMNSGIPKVIQDLTVKFHYNDPASLQELFDTYPNRIACVMMEPETIQPPTDNFLKRVQELCRKHGALFILDEMITGFRWHLGGAQTLYGVVPDLSTFGKALGNGFSISALVGKREFMDRGGIHHDKERVFLLSTTHGAENHSLAAAIAVMDTYQKEKVVEYLHRQGERLKAGVERAIAELKLDGYVAVLGRASNLVFATRDNDKNPSQPFRTLFLQEVLKRGQIMPSLVVSFSHSDQIIDRSVDAIGDGLAVYRKALDEGVDKYLVGRPVKPVFRKYC